MIEDRLPEALTFDDVLLLPGYTDFLPRDADVRTRFTRGLELYIPIVSSAMDTVTQWRAAVTMAREGGLGIVHKNFTGQSGARDPQGEARESGMVLDPVTVSSTEPLHAALALMRKHDISGLPVVDSASRSVS